MNQSQSPMRFASWALFFFLATQCSVRAQAKSRQDTIVNRLSISDRKVFGIHLHRQAFKLLTDVETFYGKQVHEERFKSADSTSYGDSWVKNDGTPIIRINESVHPSEEIIVHELFHLKLQTMGFPGPVHWEVQNELAGENNRAYFSKLNHTMLQEMLHRIFYPEMRKMKLDPDRQLEIVVVEVMEGKSQALAPVVDNLAMFYFKFTINLNDAKLVARIDKWYEDNKWIEGLEKGRKLVRIVRESSPRMPDEVIAVFLQCC